LKLDPKSLFENLSQPFEVILWSPILCWALSIALGAWSAFWYSNLLTPTSDELSDFYKYKNHKDSHLCVYFLVINNNIIIQYSGFQSSNKFDLSTLRITVRCQCSAFQNCIKSQLTTAMLNSSFFVILLAKFIQPYYVLFVGSC